MSLGLLPVNLQLELIGVLSAVSLEESTEVMLCRIMAFWKSAQASGLEICKGPWFRTL